MTDDFLDQLQADVFGILSNTPSLALARKILDDKGDLEGEIENHLATVNDESGKCGLAIIVLALEVEKADENLPGPPLQVRVDVQTLEMVELNRHVGDGTLIHSATAATRVLAALHLFQVGPCLLHAGKDPIRPLPLRTGFVGHIVSLRTRLNGVSVVSRPLAVQAAMDGDYLTFTCDTPDTVIYYTTDGSFPTRASELYDPNAPISDPAVGTAFRVAAYQASTPYTLPPSDVLEFTIRATPGAGLLEGLVAHWKLEEASAHTTAKVEDSYFSEAGYISSILGPRSDFQRDDGGGYFQYDTGAEYWKYYNDITDLLFTANNSGGDYPWDVTWPGVSFTEVVFGGSGGRDSSHPSGPQLQEWNAVIPKPGKIGMAANFSSACLEASNSFMPSLDAFTASCWVKFTSPGTILSFGDGMLELRLFDSGGWYLGVVGSDGMNIALEDFTHGDWQHLVVTWDGTTFTVYLQANFVASVNPVSPFTLAPDDFRLGCNAAQNDYIYGALDSVSLWTRALDAADITALYNSGAGLDYEDF